MITGYWRKKKGLDGKPVKRETPQNRRLRDNDNIDDKTVASHIVIPEH